MSQENPSQQLNSKENREKFTFQDLENMISEEISQKTFRKDVEGRVSKGGSAGPLTEEKCREFIIKYGLPKNTTRDDIYKAAEEERKKTTTKPGPSESAATESVIEAKVAMYICEKISTELGLPIDNVWDKPFSEENRKALTIKLKLPKNTIWENVLIELLKKYRK